MKFKILLICLSNCFKVWAQTDVNDLDLPQTQNVQLTADNKEYTLSLTLPNSQRTATILFDPTDGQLIVKGTINTYYPDAMNNLIINYVADKNGYRASYKITKILSTSAFSLTTRLSIDTLKSAAG